MEKFDVFISYRRDGGEGVAGRISDKLIAKGYKIFYDVESLRSGKFNEQIYEAIDICSDMLVVLPPNGLDRCHAEDDWVRLEIAYAIKKKKNIIPVLLRNFVFPSLLPDEIDSIRLMQGVTASSEYFDASVSRIENLLLCKKEKDAVPQRDLSVDGKVNIPLFIRTPLVQYSDDIYEYDYCNGHFWWEFINSERDNIPSEYEEVLKCFDEKAKEIKTYISPCDVNYYLHHREHYKNINNIYLVPKRYKNDNINPQELMYEISELAQTCFYNWDFSDSILYIKELLIFGKYLMGGYSRMKNFSFEVVPEFCMQYFASSSYTEWIGNFDKYLNKVSRMIYDSTIEYGVYEDAAKILNNRVKLFLKYFELISMFLCPCYKGKEIRKYLLINYKFLKKNKVVLTQNNEEFFEKIINIFGNL